MKKFIILILISLILGLMFLGKNIYTLLKNQNTVEVILPIYEEGDDFDIVSEGMFTIYVDGVAMDSFTSFEEAVFFAKQVEKSFIVKSGSSRWLWDNYPPYNVFVKNSPDYLEFYTFKEALEYARPYKKASIYYRKDSSQIWSSYDELLPVKHIQGVPSILQYPELPRGCEVTSLAMLINFKGISVSKMTLANEIVYDDTPMTNANGKVYYGNPNKGFVGDMKALTNHGYGVYHTPIYELLQRYFPYSALDLTGADFYDLYYFINRDIPVWVIINASYDLLPSSSFEIWNTDEGEVAITKREHSVLITGYDENYIYFKDPLGRESYVETNRFKAGWEQMGSQAVSLSF